MIGVFVRSFYRALPPTGQRLARWVRRAAPPLVNWGSLRRNEPFSDHYGFDRGTPIDRRLIAAFLSENRALITGRSLEVQDSGYTTRFGHGIVSVDVVDIDPGNRSANLIADLTKAGSLSREAYDCIILTQVLQFCADDRAALQNAWDAIASGGSLLITVPTGGRQMAESEGIDYRRYQASGVHWMLHQLHPEPMVSVRAYGGLVAKMADLLGLSSEEVKPADIEENDPRFAVIIGGRATKHRSS